MKLKGTIDNSVLLWPVIHRIAKLVCERYKLHYLDRIEPLIANVRYYGETRVCEACANARFNIFLSKSSPNRNSQNRKKKYSVKKTIGRPPKFCKKKVISLRLHKYNALKKPLSVSTIMDTLAHELAHLRPDCWAHGRSHQQLQKEILDYIRKIGYTW